MRNKKLICFQKLVTLFFFQLPPIALLTKGMPQAQNPHSLVASGAIGNRNKRLKHSVFFFLNKVKSHSKDSYFLFTFLRIADWSSRGNLRIYFSISSCCTKAHLNIKTLNLHVHFCLVLTKAG